MEIGNSIVAFLKLGIAGFFLEIEIFSELGLGVGSYVGLSGWSLGRDIGGSFCVLWVYF